MKLTLKYLKESAARKAYNGLTRLRAWWPIVNQNFIDIEAAVNSLNDGIAYEAAERERVDGVLFDNITDATAAIAAEITARANADTALRRSIDVLQKVFNFDRDITSIEYISEGINFPAASEPIGTPMVIYNDTDNDVSYIDTGRVGREGNIIYFFDHLIPPGEYRLCFVTRNGDGVDTGMVHIVDHDADISALAAQITAAKNAINTLNGDDTVTGSVAKKIKDALAANGATAAEIREAWNPTPTTPTVTLEGVYDDVNSALIVTSTELAKLAAIDEGETFDIVIHATGVEYSGAAKYVSYIGANSDGAPPGYFLTNNGVPLWDSEYDYNTFHGCVMVSHYDRIDTGEIREGSW